MSNLPKQPNSHEEVDGHVAQALFNSVGESLEEARADIAEIIGRDGLTKSARTSLRGVVAKMTRISADLHKEVHILSGGSEASSELITDVRISTPLTLKEEEILRLLESGDSAPAMAEKLFLSVNTVKTHLASLYRKLSATNKVEALSHARQAGLLSGWRK